MGGIATFDKKGSHLQRFGLNIFVIAAKAAKAQKLGGGKQKITVLIGTLVSRARITFNRNRNS